MYLKYTVKVSHIQEVCVICPRQPPWYQCLLLSRFNPPWLSPRTIIPVAIKKGIRYNVLVFHGFRVLSQLVDAGLAGKNTFKERNRPCKKIIGEP